MSEGLGIFVLIVVAVVIFYLLRAIRMVPQGYNYTVERFGRYIRTLEPGLGLIVPFIDRIGAKQNIDRPMITDWESFEAYRWNDPANFDTSRIERAREFLPEGMKLMVMGPCGVLENAISLAGYDNLCVMLFEEPELVKEITDHIGSALVKYYEMIAEIDTVGFLCSNDDWGFNTQTFLSPPDMRKYIFPWHKKIVEIAHRAGKPCILHSCGYFDEVIGDIIGDMKFDARHSYEDNIRPVEDAYEGLAGKIAVLGGIDMNFMVSQTPARIYDRATAMLERSRTRGGYLLGTGNSVPTYIPFENYSALLRAAEEFR